MSAESLAENIPNAPQFICSSPKVLDFNEKRIHWTSVVHGLDHREYQKVCFGFLNYRLVVIVMINMLCAHPIRPELGAPHSISASSYGIRMQEGTIFCLSLKYT